MTFQIILTFTLFIASFWLNSADRFILSVDDRIIRKECVVTPKNFFRLRLLQTRPFRLRFACMVLDTAVSACIILALFSITSKFGKYAFGADYLSAALVFAALRLLAVKTIPDAFTPEFSAKFALRSVFLAIIILWLFEPFAYPLRLLSSSFLKVLRARKPRLMTEDEFLSGIEVGEAQGAVRDEECEMVSGILSLENLKTSEVMTPRVDLIGLNADESNKTWMSELANVYFRHVPVFKGSMDNIVKMLDLPRFFYSAGIDREFAMSNPLFVSESATLDKVLSAMRAQRVRCAIALDEYGGTAGIITRGDIFEEILDGVSGPKDGMHTSPIVKLQDGGWLVDGMTSLEDINIETNLGLKSDDSDRISGWVLERRVGIPHLGEIIEDQGCRVIVARVRHNRLLQLRISKMRQGASK